MNSEKITAVVAVLMKTAEYEWLFGDEIWYGKIEGLQGVWASAQRLAECKLELAEVLTEWLKLE